jgi:hypothetical protein
MLFYGDLLKRGEIPVKDLQLSKHQVYPAVATAQSPESASPECVPPQAGSASASPVLSLSSPPKEVTREDDGFPKVTQPVMGRAGLSLRTLPLTLCLATDPHCENQEQINYSPLCSSSQSMLFLLKLFGSGHLNIPSLT